MGGNSYTYKMQRQDGWIGNKDHASHIISAIVFGGCGKVERRNIESRQ